MGTKSLKEAIKQYLHSEVEEDKLKMKQIIKDYRRKYGIPSISNLEILLIYQ